MNAHTYLQESIHITFVQVQLHGYTSMSWHRYTCAYTHMQANPYSYSQLHVHTKLCA